MILRIVLLNWKEKNYYEICFLIESELTTYLTPFTNTNFYISFSTTNYHADPMRPRVYNCDDVCTQEKLQLKKNYTAVTKKAHAKL